MGLYIHFWNETCFIIWLSAHLHIRNICFDNIHYYQIHIPCDAHAFIAFQLSIYIYIVLVKIFVLFFNKTEQTQTIHSKTSIARVYIEYSWNIILNRWLYRLVESYIASGNILYVSTWFLTIVHFCIGKCWRVGACVSCIMMHAFNIGLKCKGLLWWWQQWTCTRIVINGWQYDILLATIHIHHARLSFFNWPHIAKQYTKVYIYIYDGENKSKLLNWSLLGCSIMEFVTPSHCYLFMKYWKSVYFRLYALATLW